LGLLIFMVLFITVPMVMKKVKASKNTGDQPG
jgi:hypothetical protein